MDREFVLPTESEKLPHRAIFDAIRRRREEAETHLAESEIASGVSLENVEEITMETSEPTHEHHETEVELEPVQTVASEGENASLPNPTTPIKPLRFADGKKYFRIAEVSELLEVDADHLRRWEQHFGTLVKPERDSGQRVYRRKDVRALHLIRHMIVEENYAVADARRYYRARRRALDEQAGVERQRAIESLEATARELRELLRLAIQH